MKGPPITSLDLAQGLERFPPPFFDQDASNPLLPQPFFDAFGEAVHGSWDLSGPSVSGQLIPRREGRRRRRAAIDTRRPGPAVLGPPVRPQDIGSSFNVFPFQNPNISPAASFVSPVTWSRHGRPDTVPPSIISTVSTPDIANQSPVFEHWMSMKARTVPLDHDDLKILKTKEVKPASKTHSLSTLEAIRLIVVARDKAAELKDEDFKYSVQAKTVKEFAYAIFNEVDALCFAGMLRGNVYLKCGTKMAPGVLGRTKRPPQTGSRIAIWLSDILCAEADPEVLLEVLVHQMCHAFLLQCCEPKSDKDPGYKHPLSHDPTFSAVSCAVQQAIRTQPLAYPSLLGCNAVPDEPVSMGPNSSHLLALKHSHCSEEDMGKPLDECDVVLMQIKQRAEVPKVKLDKGCAKDDSGRLLPTSQWLHDKPCSNKPVLKVEYEKDTPDYITLLYKNRGYPISRKKCAELAPAKLEMDEDLTDEKTFRLVYEYLTSGRIIPGPPAYSAGIHYPHPPSIAPLMPAEAPYFLTQLRAYRAAMQLNLPKMRELAVQNLEKSARSKCVEDPIVLLEMLYHGTTALGAGEASQGLAVKDKAKDEDQSGSKGDSKTKLPTMCPAPDRDLRAWARGFLKAPTDDQKLPANLDILKRGDQYKLRWSHLRMKGKLLLEDADQCEAELMDEREKKVKKESETEAVKTDATYRAAAAASQNMVPRTHSMPTNMLAAHMPPPGFPQPYRIVPAAAVPPLLLGQPSTRHDEARSETDQERQHMKSLETQYHHLQLQDERERLEKERNDLEEAKKNFKADLSRFPQRFVPQHPEPPFPFFPPGWHDRS